MTQPRLYIVPLHLHEANELVAAWHRHHKPALNHRFSLGVVDEAGVLHGAAMVGRPVARLGGSPRDVLEVARLVTDGTPNACSALYAACARAGMAMGYRRIQTFILGSEPGTSLRAAGWVQDSETNGGAWDRPSRTRDAHKHPTDPKTRWSRALATARPDLSEPPKRIGDQPEALDLFSEATA